MDVLSLVLGGSWLMLGFLAAAFCFGLAVGPVLRRGIFPIRDRAHTRRKAAPLMASVKSFSAVASPSGRYGKSR
jgi:hypothetical protein